MFWWSTHTILTLGIDWKLIWDCQNTSILQIYPHVLNSDIDIKIDIWKHWRNSVGFGNLLVHIYTCHFDIYHWLKQTFWDFHKTSFPAPYKLIWQWLKWLLILERRALDGKIPHVFHSTQKIPMLNPYRAKVKAKIMNC